MRCPVCENTENFHALFPRYCKTENHLCLDCGLVFITRRTDINAAYYKRGSYFTKSPNIALRKQMISRSLLIKYGEKHVTTIVSLLGESPHGKSVVDVGCAYGETLYVLKRDYNCKVVGIEPSMETSQIGKELFDIRIEPVLLQEFQGEGFDLVLCSHTLEHVDNPYLFLRRLQQLMKPSGVLYLEVPNILWPTGSYSLKKFLYHEHLQNFSAFNLAKLCHKAGLIVANFRDTSFLQFRCQSVGGESKAVAEISPVQILSFLERYSKEYGIHDYAKVYGDKLKYLLDLLLRKMWD